MSIAFVLIGLNSHFIPILQRKESLPNTACIEKSLTKFIFLLLTSIGYLTMSRDNVVLFHKKNLYEILGHSNGL